jgi:hypothetical protein
MNKRSLISESVTTTRMNIHLAGEEPDQHAIRATLGVSRTSTICEVPTNSKYVPCYRDEVLSPSNTRPGRHPGLPHSPSNKTPQSSGYGSAK